MRRPISAAALLAAVLILPSCSTDSNPVGSGLVPENPVVVMETSLGDITLVLYPRDAPVTVANFLGYVRDYFYDGLTFHRVIEPFIIQGGGFDADMRPRRPGPPIPNEADNGLKNRRGTIAMVRRADPQSATSQFFINTKDNPLLDFTDATPRGWGYCVFGEVIDGMDVVDRIAGVPTTSRNGYNDVPVVPVIIRRVSVTGWPRTSPF